MVSDAGGAKAPPRPRRLPNTSLIQIVINPLDSWKTCIPIFRKAKSLGMEVVVALDERSTNDSYAAVKEVADIILPFKNETVWPEVILNELLLTAHRDWVARIEDDEEPSPQLWEFLTKEPTLKNNGDPFLWRFKMLAPFPDWSGLYRPMSTYQPRYYPRLGLRHPGGFDQLPMSPYAEIDCDLVLWHYVEWAPRDHREKKVRDHEAAWYKFYESHPWPPSSNKAYLWEDYPAERDPIEPWEKFLPPDRSPFTIAPTCGPCSLCRV